MALGLHQDTLAGVDQDDGKLRGRGAGRHVARVLLMARRVRDHEGAPRGREEAVGDVDGDALLPLGLEAVDQERKIDVVAGGAMLGAVARERGELILEDPLAVVQQPPDQGRLAVVDRAAGDEAQLVLDPGRMRFSKNGGVHQK